MTNLDYDTRNTISSCLRLSKDANTTEGERLAAQQQLEKLLAEHNLTMADAQRIADEFVTETSTDTDEDGCTPYDLIVIIIDLLRQYVWCPNEHVYLIAALWILHTHCYRQFRHTPRLIIYAPLSQSGKTTFMTLIRFLSCGGELLGDVTSASLFRDIHDGIHTTELYTKFVDEMDNAEFDKTFHRTFNNGYAEGGRVGRTIGGKKVSFDVHAPLCFASISKAGFTPTNLSRSHLLKMHKKGARKLDQRLQSEIYPSEDIVDVRYHIDVWAKRVGGNNPFDGKLNRRPELPAALVDRDEDRWIPLLSIADACGFGDEARSVATSTEFAIANPDVKVDLVRDIRRVFDELKDHPDRIWSEQLAGKLHEIHEAPWGGEFCGLDGKKQPHKISKGEIGHILRRTWEIQPQSIRIGAKTSKGYYRWQCEQAWSDVGLPPSTALTATPAAPRKRRTKVRRRVPAPKKRHNGTTARRSGKARHP